jgi:hypothetical protein
MTVAVDFQKYTRKQAGKELAAIEQHLRGFNAGSASFCMECIGKHAMHLSALASEGKGFFPDDEDWWAGLEEWIDGVLEEGENAITMEQISRWVREARKWRKELQAKYMGNMGKCECVTGKEICCPHSKGA